MDAESGRSSVPNFHPAAAVQPLGSNARSRKSQAQGGPRNLRPKTVRQITRRQRQGTEENGDRPAECGSSPDAVSTPLSQVKGDTTPQGSARTSISSLVLRLCIFRLRLYPVWPIVSVEDVTADLQKDDGDKLVYALANAVGAATMAQLKLDSFADTASASWMEAECHRARSVDGKGRYASLDTLRIAFFLHVYHENLEPGDVSSLSYLCEAITLAQIMGLHRESTYIGLSTSQQESRRRILWLLFVTERGVAMLHNLPAVLRCNTRFPSADGGEDNHVLPAFRKLVNLFWIFDQSGAFDILQNIDDVDIADARGTDATNQNQSSLDVLQQRLQDVPIDWEASNDVQRADICVTRQWMRAVLWRISLLRNSGSDHVTSLSHPIQIAHEFLAVISKLPNAAIESHGPSIEFKIFEIASAVTDALNASCRTWTFPENSREVLNQLHRILMSCRGGNETLSMMLRMKIAEIQNGEPLLLEPSSRIREACESDRLGTPTGFSSEDGNDRGLVPISPSHLTIRSQLNDDRGRASTGARAEDPGTELEENQQQILLAGQDPSWYTIVDSDLTRTLANSWDLYEQLQSFDGSFNGFESFDALDPFLPNTEASRAPRGSEFSAVAPPSPIFSR